MRLDVVLVNLTGNETAKNILRSEMARRDVSTQQLTDMLIAQGIDVTKASVDSKLSRGTFSADFFVDCLRVIGCQDMGIVTETIFKDS